jgi:3-hydroxybutyryl-CoA dehydrogenase
MSDSHIKKILVVGAGQMGAGIAQVSAQAGFEVLLVDALQASLDKARAGIEKSLAKLKEKGLLAEEPVEVMARFKWASSLGDSKAFAPQMVIEAVSENLSVKQKIFEELDALLAPEVIFCSNTSSISITKLASFTKRADRFMGMHFMNPVPLMKLVELIEGLSTSREVSRIVRGTAERMGKTCVVSKDRAGFIINRILMPMINEAFFVLGEDLGTAEDIDLGMKLGTNQPMGPLALADFIGLDTCLSILEVMHKYLGEDKYRPAPLLRQYVDAGRLGKKTGIGVYAY